MRKAFSDQTRNLEQAAERLRADYEVERLHDLRVAIRRIRSLLKQHGRHRARRWRRIWGSFARVTGRARDWDVFLEAADALLPPPQMAVFQATSQPRVNAARDAVRAMLDSTLWRRQLEEWKAYASLRPRPRRRKARRATAHKAPTTAALKPVLARANRALAEALALPDDSGWHPFRIAVKELRYLAERLPADSAGPIDPQVVVDTCKSLQTSLGGWHDCVIQLQLLDELERGAPANDSVLRELREAIEALRRQRLAEIREAVAQQPLLQALRRGPMLPRRPAGPTGGRRTA